MQLVLAFVCYLSHWMGKYLNSAYNLACQRACLTYCVRIICFRASQRRVLHRVLLVTSSAFSCLRFRVWHDFRMQLPALVTGRNNAPAGCAASQRDLVRLEKWADRTSWCLRRAWCPVLDRNNPRHEHMLGARCHFPSLEQGHIAGSCSTCPPWPRGPSLQSWFLASCPWPVLDPELIPP